MVILAVFIRLSVCLAEKWDRSTALAGDEGVATEQFEAEPEARIAVPWPGGCMR